MKYLRQFCIIIGFSLLGELLNWLLPLPIPASVYGILILFAALYLRILKPESIRETANFLIMLMPLLFVAPLVNLIDFWPMLSDNLVPILVIIFVSTVLTFGVSGWITQRTLSKGEREDL